VLLAERVRQRLALRKLAIEKIGEIVDKAKRLRIYLPQDGGSHRRTVGRGVRKEDEKRRLGAIPQGVWMA